MQASRHVQTQAPADWHRRLRDLSYDTQRSVADLLLDGLLLLLRFHDRGAGLPAPMLPKRETLQTTPTKAPQVIGQAIKRIPDTDVDDSEAGLVSAAETLGGDDVAARMLGMSPAELVAMQQRVSATRTLKDTKAR